MADILRPITDRERWMRINAICSNPESEDIRTLRQLLVWMEEEKGGLRLVANPWQAQKKQLCRALKKQQGWVSWMNPFYYQEVAHGVEGALALKRSILGTEANFLKWLNRSVRELVGENPFVHLARESLLDGNFRHMDVLFEEYVHHVAKNRTIKKSADINYVTLTDLRSGTKKALDQVGKLERYASTIGHKFLTRGRLYRTGNLTEAQKVEARGLLHFLEDLKERLDRFVDMAASLSHADYERLTGLHRR